MASRIDAITITARDHESLGAFWQQLLGLAEDPANPNSPGDPVTEFVLGPVPVTFLFQPSGDDPHLAPDEFRPRIHFDLDALDCTRDEEVDRVVSLGAEIVADARRPDGTGWVTVRDPDGYEFCIQRSAEERAAGPSPATAP